MQQIIDPVDVALLESELNADTFVRKSNYGDNEIYVVNVHNAPNTVNEIGRLREVTFRTAGGGTGKELDLDSYDTSENCYQQLLVWNPEDKRIIGGYRYIHGYKVIDADRKVHLATSKLFELSDTFIDNYLPTTIELGRSFVQPDYQPALNNRKGLFSLDNLWDGLGALVVRNPEMKYFFGKITMYPTFNEEARDMIMHFMEHYFPDKEGLLIPHEPLNFKTDISSIEGMFQGMEYKEGHRLLTQQVRKLGEHVPPLVNAYMGLSATMKYFGTAINRSFGEVEETGILVTIADIYDSKKERHVSTYEPDLSKEF